jgi:hypothetical protein
VTSAAPLSWWSGGGPTAAIYFDGAITPEDGVGEDGLRRHGGRLRAIADAISSYLRPRESQ